jgi:hypothetical protein
VVPIHFDIAAVSKSPGGRHAHASPMFVLLCSVRSLLQTGIGGRKNRREEKNVQGKRTRKRVIQIKVKKRIIEKQIGWTWNERKYKKEQERKKVENEGYRTKRMKMMMMIKLIRC